MGNLFSGGGSKKPKKPASRVTEQDKAILQLKQQRDKLKQYQKKIDIQLEKDREVARSLLREGKRDKAKLLLRKKKFQESLLKKTDGQLDNIEQMVQDLEFAQVESAVVKGLQVGNASLKKMHEILSVEDVERIMDETHEGIEKQQEIDDLLSGGLTAQDESDVLAELEEIMKSSAESEDLNLPEVPQESIGEPGDVPAKKTKLRQEEGDRTAVLAS